MVLKALTSMPFKAYYGDDAEASAVLLEIN